MLSSAGESSRRRIEFKSLSEEKQASLGWASVLNPEGSPLIKSEPLNSFW